MANMIKFFKGSVNTLPATGVDGALYITNDEGAIYLGTGTGMKRLGDFIQVDAVKDLPTAGANTSALYYCVGENILAKWTGSEWKQVNKQPTTEELKTLLGLGDLAYKSEVAEDDLSTALKEKVNAASEGNHAHLNKALLDTYTQTEEDLADAVAKKHAHANAEELAKIADGDKAKWDAVAADYLTSEDKAEIEDAIAEIRDDENIDSFADVVAELAKKQDTIPANTYDAYGAADQAYEDAVEYFEAEMGTIFSEFNEDIGNLEKDVRGLEEDVEKLETFIDRDGGLTDRINTAVSTEETRAKGVEKDLQDAIDAINDTEGGILKQAKDYADGKDAAIEAAQKAGDDAMAEAVKKVASVTAADKSVTIGGTSTAPTVAAKLSADADNALTLAEDGLKVVIPDAAEYSIVKAADSGEYAAVYNLTKDGAIVGASINIPKDMVVKSGSVVGDEIILVLNDEANTEIKIAVGSLIEYVTSGSATGDMVFITVDETTHKVTATITDGTITAAKLSTALQTAIGKAHNHANADLLAEINADRFDAWDEAEQNAKDYADELAEAADERLDALEAINHEAYIGADATLKGELQAEIDADVKVVADDLAEYVEANDAAVALKANADEVYAKTETYTKEEVEAAIATAVETAHTWGEF